MKFAAIVAGLVFATSAGAQTVTTTGAPIRVTISATVVDVRETPFARIHVQHLWNRDVRSRPIGHALLSCVKVGHGGILGSGVSSCDATYVLPLGKITAQGIAHSYRRYTLVLTGGTGRYLGIEGSVFVRRIGPGVQRVVFNP